MNPMKQKKTKHEKYSEETAREPIKKDNAPRERRISFEAFKSNVCHRVKELGDLGFMIEILENNTIDIFFEQKWYPESLYLLAMLDYLSRVNDIPLCEKYNDLRKCKLKEIIYPASIICMCVASGNQEAMERSRKEAIPEFMRFNIVESEIRNVV